ncbi:MAG TPA: ABC transporter ATP-binding protein [Acidimicrobiales bacterium]|jgi:branched-chain amino acid transport system ATP-binding protein
MAQLAVDNVQVRFGGKLALGGVSLTVEPGRVTGLIGPNGAGKTTLFNVVTGLLSANSGRVALDGRDISRLPPHRRAKRGVARTFQRLELFTSLSVRDNVRVAGEIRNGWAGGPRLNASAETERVLALVGLAEVADREVSELPTGQARRVELARALMIHPTVLLLDEPAAGQTEQETIEFGRLVRTLAADGLAVCLVEHDMSLVMNVCETIHVLDMGQLIATGTPDAVRADPAVIEAYLGAPEAVA